MKNIKLCFWSLIIAITALWLAADHTWLGSHDFFQLRSSSVNFTGLIAIGFMSLSMMLATRPLIVESWLGGLDKMYRLHKWLGITGVVFALAHLLWAKSAGWLVGWGLLVRQAGRHGVGRNEGVEGFFQEHRKLAESIGEWALYALVLLVVLALLKRFSYRYFSKTHRLLAIIYLFLVFHSVVLMKFAYWGKPIGAVMAVLMVGGVIAAFVSLFGRVGSRRRTTGEIEGVTLHMDNRVLRVEVKLTAPWPGHLAGQFAFLTFDPKEGPHPFTISSSWNSDGKLAFLIKGLGDYTDTLAGRLKRGDRVALEGPYGKFDFKGSSQRQIWIAGGIGITPFIAKMNALLAHPDGVSVDLFYSTSAPDEGFIRELRKQAEAAQVQLHVMVPSRDGRLTGERIRSLFPDWKSASFWFCGPAGFGRCLFRDLTSQGLLAVDFHQELFDMR